MFPPADLGEQFQPSSSDLREGDRERGRKPITKRHAVQSRPTAHLHPDRQTGELMTAEDTHSHTLQICQSWPSLLQKCPHFASKMCILGCTRTHAAFVLHHLCYTRLGATVQSIRHSWILLPSAPVQSNNTLIPNGSDVITRQHTHMHTQDTTTAKTC